MARGGFWTLCVVLVLATFVQGLAPLRKVSSAARFADWYHDVCEADLRTFGQFSSVAEERFVQVSGGGHGAAAPTAAQESFGGGRKVVPYESLPKDLQEDLGQPVNGIYTVKFPNPRVTPLFYRHHEGRWQWSPPGRRSSEPSGTWMPVSELWVTCPGSCLWKGQKPYEGNIKIIVGLDLLEEDAAQEIDEHHGEHDAMVDGHGTSGEHSSEGGHTVCKPGACRFAEHGDHGEHHHSALENAIHLIHEVHLGLEGIEIAEHKHLMAKVKDLYRSSLFVMRESKLHDAFLATKRALVSGKIQSIEAAEVVKQFYRNRYQSKKNMKIVSDFKRTWAANAAKFKQAKAIQNVGARLKAIATVAQRFAKVTAAVTATKVGAALLRTGKFAINPKFLGGLMVLGGVLEGVDGFQKADSKTMAGKVVTGIAVGAGAMLIMSNPVVALLDLVLPKEYKLSTLVKGGINLLVAWGEGILTGDREALDLVMNKIKSGEYGKFLEWAAEGGEAAGAFVARMNAKWQKSPFRSKLQAFRKDVFACLGDLGECLDGDF